MRQCNYGPYTFQPGWDYNTYPAAYDNNGWTWEYTYVATNCDFWTRRRRALLVVEEGAAYVSVPDPDFVYTPPCATPADANISRNACDAAETGSTACCTQLGGGFCDALKMYCYDDACLATDIAAAATGLFTDVVTLVCALDTAAGAGTLFAAAALVEAPGAATYSPTYAPAVVTTGAPTAPTTAKETTKAGSDANALFVPLISVIMVVAVALLQ